jgi:hypothetical protein
MSFDIGTILGKVFAIVVGRLIEYFRQRDLEKKAAHAADLEKYIASTDEAEEVEKRILATTKDMNNANIAVLTATEKLKRIREFNERHLGPK